MVGQWEGGGTQTGAAFDDLPVGALPAGTGKAIRFTLSRHAAPPLDRSAPAVPAVAPAERTCASVGGWLSTIAPRFGHADSMTTTLALEVARSSPDRTRLVEAPTPAPEAGEVLLAVERVACTANNATYALLGDELGYWRFFPTDDEGWGRVPMWAALRVLDSRSDHLTAGDRLFGLAPLATHQLLTPRRSTVGVTDTSAHRAELPGAYNAYLPLAVAVEDPVAEDRLLLLRPLFLLSFLLDDLLAEERLFGGERVLVSSASSKSAIGLAFLLAERGAEVVALTSPRNRAFVERLRLHDAVVDYAELETLDTRPTTYADLAGDGALRGRVHEHLGAALRHSAIVGATHRDARAFAGGADGLPGPAPQLFFVPDRLRTRMRDWGPAEYDRRLQEAWERWSSYAAGWLEVTRATGPEAVAAAWRDVLAGQAPPQSGSILTLR